MKNTNHISNQQGFTLIELLIVIVLMSALTTMSIMYAPGMLAGYRIRGAARQLHSDMQMARLRAIKEGKEYALEFSGDAYCIKTQINTTLTPPSSDGWTDGCTTANDTITKPAFDLSREYSGFSIRSSPTRNIFYPDGRAGYNGGSSITVTGRNGTRTIRLIPNTGTGNIRIQ